MGLMPAYYTTNNTRRRKKKKNVNPSKYEMDWRKHNKFLKSIRCQTITLEEYIDYCHGKSKSGKCYGSTSVSKTEGRGSTPCPDANSYRRETPDIPSVGSLVGVATKKEMPVYTGNAVIGQAYNKGGLQVLSAQEASDPMTGKRR